MGLQKTLSASNREAVSSGKLCLRAVREQTHPEFTLQDCQTALQQGTSPASPSSPQGRSAFLRKVRRATRVPLLVMDLITAFPSRLRIPLPTFQNFLDKGLRLIRNSSGDSVCSCGKHTLTDASQTMTLLEFSHKFIYSDC